MYDFLHGRLHSAQGREIVLRVVDIGYTLNVSAGTMKQVQDFSSDASALFYVHHQILADQGEMRLYGFLTRDERVFFRSLLKVSGVGPGTAIRIMDAGTPAQIRELIQAKDVAALKKLPGIGPKTAQKIITELGRP